MSWRSGFRSDADRAPPCHRSTVTTGALLRLPPVGKRSAKAHPATVSTTQYSWVAGDLAWVDVGIRVRRRLNVGRHRRMAVAPGGVPGRGIPIHGGGPESTRDER
jgi:hypothetical protein